jgi:serine/threonine protein kinase
MKIEFSEAFYTTEKDKLISITKDAELVYVYSEKYGYLKLDQNNVMFGGEGKIYRTYENLLVKIYSDDEKRYETAKKIQRLIDMDLRNKYIVWPKDIVYNNNEFVGYVMEEIRDTKGLDMYRIYSFNNMTYKERFKVCIDLLKLIDYLHEKAILVGDLKFDNILLTNKSKELYIIDSGSFQLEDYSCGVFNAAYTHDNLKGKNLRQVLRTLEEEYFPINKILFEVLMGKGPFYDFVSGEVGSEVERNFHYPMTLTKSIKDRTNPLFYWTNGDARLREVFYNYFQNGEILEVKDWIVLLEDILKGAH